MDPLARLQALLRDLFQLDTADLDFGIYRLFHLKREEFERFISEQLPRVVEESFRSASAQEQAQAATELQTLGQQIRMEFGDPDAIAPTGEVREKYRNAIGKSLRELIDRYENQRERVQEAHLSEAQAADVFNHLYAFFSRYYDEGDFVPRRYYGEPEAYAVPYNGEETYFHWANRGQQYVKTGEHFRDYAFTVDFMGSSYRVRFALTAASSPRHTAGRDTRFFFPIVSGLGYDAINRTLTLPFEYRLPSEDELSALGGSSVQGAILDAAEQHILAAVPEEPLALALSEPSHATEADSSTLLMRRMVHFARRQTSDYFVYPDLQAFLARELEFYLKDQALRLADMEGDLASKLRLLRAVRLVAQGIIAFLSEIEDVQCRLYEKKKFVLRADYLCPIRQVPKTLWADVLANTAQLDAWRDLFAVDAEPDQDYLEHHPTLVVDTSHFEDAFRLRLLAAFPDLDTVTDGVCVHSDNYQALNVLLAGYGRKVKCIYIDPPYNTGSDGFIYKDRYAHSSWLSMMRARLRLARAMLRDDGAIFVSIDDNEVHELRLLMDELFGPENFVATVIWQKVFAPKNSARHFSEDHDYILVYARNADLWTPVPLPRSKEAEARYSNPDNDPRGPWTSGDLTARNYYSEGEYEVTSPSGQCYRPSVGTYWRVKHEKFLELDRDGRVWWGASGDGMPRLKRFLSEVKQGIVPQTLWTYREVGHTQEAKKQLLEFVRFERTDNVLDTVKPTRLIRRILQLAASTAGGGDVVMDFFAGSASSAHAVIEQNREDGLGRRFVSVQLPEPLPVPERRLATIADIGMERIQRAMYCPEWREGQPKDYPQLRLDGMWPDWVMRTPRLVKVVRLESYDDALHNLAATQSQPDAAGAFTLPGAKSADIHRLTYVFSRSLADCPSLLSTERLDNPFGYCIEVLTDEGPRLAPVDLVETFSALYGLRVQRIELWSNPADGREYRAVAGHREGKTSLVIWRDVTELDPVVERAFLESRIQGFDEALINGDCAVPGVRSLDPIFRRLVEGNRR